MQGNVEAVELLLDRGADTEAKDSVKPWWSHVVESCWVGLKRWLFMRLAVAYGSIVITLTVGFCSSSAGWQGCAGPVRKRSLHRSASQFRAAPAMAPPQSPCTVDTVMRRQQNVHSAQHYGGELKLVSPFLVCGWPPPTLRLSWSNERAPNASRVYDNRHAFASAEQAGWNRCLQGQGRAYRDEERHQASARNAELSVSRLQAKVPARASPSPGRTLHSCAPACD